MPGTLGWPCADRLLPFPFRKGIKRGPTLRTLAPHTHISTTSDCIYLNHLLIGAAIDTPEGGRPHREPAHMCSMLTRAPAAMWLNATNFMLLKPVRNVSSSAFVWRRQKDTVQCCSTVDVS